MIKELFAAIDRQDACGFSAFLTEDCAFRFGNQPVVQGRDAVRDAVAVFLQSVQAIQHQIDQQWHTGDALVCHGTVIYTRHSGSQLAVPFCNVLNLTAGRIHEYLIFADTSLLYTDD